MGTIKMLVISIGIATPSATPTIPYLLTKRMLSAIFAAPSAKTMNEYGLCLESPKISVTDVICIVWNMRPVIRMMRT